MIKPADQRVGIFVDVANLYHSAKNLHSSNVSYSYLLEKAVASRKLIRAFAYVVKSETPEEQTFFEALDKQGFEVRSKDLQVFAGGAKKGDWDVGLTIDAIKMADRLDAVIIASGDGDYMPLVQYLQYHNGCRVEVMAFGQSSSAGLIEMADEFIDLSQDPKNLIRSNKRRYTSRKRYVRKP